MVMKKGAVKYGKENWHKIPVVSDGKNAGHLDHVHEHLAKYEATGDIEELEHAAARVLMALELVLTGKDVGK
jgi:hypothetical protein